MIKTLYGEMVLLALHKKGLKEKIAYLFKGMLFLPFLIKDTLKTERKEDVSASMSAAGDDIYPLF